MAINNSGWWFIDGMDTWQAFGLTMHEGTASFLDVPPKKDSIEHDWQDTHGRDVDLERFFYDQREHDIQCSIIATKESDFFDKRDKLMNRLTLPGLRRLSFTSHGPRNYYVYYKKCSTFMKSAEGVRGSQAEGLFMYTFTLTLIEPTPTGVDNNNEYIVDEQGRFIVT